MPETVPPDIPPDILRIYQRAEDIAGRRLANQYLSIGGAIAFVVFLVLVGPWIWLHYLAMPIAVRSFLFIFAFITVAEAVTTFLGLHETVQRGLKYTVNWTLATIALYVGVGAYNGWPVPNSGPPPPTSVGPIYIPSNEFKLTSPWHKTGLILSFRDPVRVVVKDFTLRSIGHQSAA